MIRITPSISIAERELEEHFIRAPGPGGQNVNKPRNATAPRSATGKTRARVSCI